MKPLDSEFLNGLKIMFVSEFFLLIFSFFPPILILTEYFIPQAFETIFVASMEL